MIGELLGSYRVTAVLGNGGMGVVYLAEHPALRRQAAVKVLQPDLSRDTEMVMRFFNEARAATLIKHPGIVAIFDFGTHASGSAYLVMEYLEGQSLWALVQREPRLPLERLVAIGRQIASALAAAHTAGIVHRDLKPANLFLVDDPDMPFGQRAKVLDFGIAKLSEEAARHGGVTSTVPGRLMGTPAYMAPEQCRGAGGIDARADIYALGCILFEMATGAPPFGRSSDGSMLSAHLEQTPPRLARVRPDLPRALSDLVDRCLAKLPAARPQSMHELVTALAMLAGGMPTPRPPVVADVEPAAVDATVTASAVVDRPGAGRWPALLRSLWKR